MTNHLLVEKNLSPWRKRPLVPFLAVGTIFCIYDKTSNGTSGRLRQQGCPASPELVDGSNAASAIFPCFSALISLATFILHLE